MVIEKQKEVRFSPDAEQAYKELQQEVIEEKARGVANSFSQQLLRSIDREKENLRLDSMRGKPIPKTQVPAQVKQKYGLGNLTLFKISLIGFWRMLYTITGTEIKIIAIILDFIDHKTYDRMFGYRKK